jgi:hypothetical protein
MATPNEHGSLPTATGDVLDAKIVDLAKMSIVDLRATWLKHLGQAPPKRLSRDLMARGIAYKLQERRFGGLSKSAHRMIDRFRRHDESSGDSLPKRTRSMKPGSKLIRDWGGATHTVLVLDDGFEWQGEAYKSLTQIARAITGAHWSGPRFFGLADSIKSPTPRWSG